MRHKRWYVEEGVPGPISGILAAIVALFAHSVLDVKDFHRNLKAHKKHQKQQKDTSEDEKKNYYSAGVDPSLSPLRSAGRLGKELTIDIATCKPQYCLFPKPTSN